MVNPYLEMSIPGMKSATNPNHSKWRRLFWKLLLLVCFLVSVTEIYQRLILYFSHPTDFTFQFRHETNMFLPGVTICSSFGFDINQMKLNLQQSSLEKYSNLSSVNVTDYSALLKYMTLDEVWQFSGENIDHFMEKVICNIIKLVTNMLSNEWKSASSWVVRWWLEVVSLSQKL